jgi:hypothetical protein
MVSLDILDLGKVKQERLQGDDITPWSMNSAISVASISWFAML